MRYDQYIELYHMPDDEYYERYVDNELKRLKRRNDSDKRRK